MATEREELAPLVGQVVVIDTTSSYVYAGTLKEAQDNFLVLTDVDVHDCSEGRSGKDLYILEARRNGVQKNRRQVVIRKDHVVSISRLEDVLMY